MPYIPNPNTPKPGWQAWSKETKEDVKLTAEEAASLEEARATVSSLQGLLHHPGWEIMKLSIKATANLMEEQAINSLEPYQSARYLGALKALKEVINYPENEIKRLQSELPGQV